MKKHLIAAAVAAAIAVPAMAQVTVSGTFDTFVGKVDSGSTAVNSSLFTSGTSGISTSLLNFSGSEDLGGGLKASFLLTNYFTSNTGADAAQNDISIVSLSGGFGAITLGRNASNASEAFGVGRFGGNLGRLDSANANVARETSNSMSYTTPTISGITAELFRGNEFTVGTGNNDTSAYSVRYAQGPFALAVGRADGNTNATTKTKLTSAGAQINLGVARLGVVFIAFDPTVATANTEQETTQFHAEIPLGNGTRLLGTFGKQETKGVANGGSDHFVVGVEKALSKRTSVYAAHLSVDNEAAALFRIRGLEIPTAGNDPTTTMVGVRHSF